jgi:PAS domain S-box-containing protein
VPQPEQREAGRLHAVRRYLAAAEPEGELGDLARLAARVLRTPVASIELLDARRRWVLAREGLVAADFARDTGPCASVVEATEPVVVPDAHADRWFRGDALVRGADALRFFAATPLRAPGGEVVGALWVADRVSREPEPEALEDLAALARQVMSQLELRLARLREAASGPSAADVLLLENEERLRLALEIGRLATWEWNFETGQVRRSGSVDRAAGVEPGALERTPEGLLRRVHPEDRPRVEQALRDAREKGITYRADYRLVRPDGGVVWVAGAGRVVADASGRPTRMIGLGVDITERKRAELEREELLAREQAAREDAQAANRAKDDFLAVLSHELRTPLNAILGWSQLLAADPVGQGEAKLAIQTIERNARLQQKLVGDLLDVSRIVHGELRLELGSYDPVSLVRAGLEALRPAIEAKRLEVQTTFDATGPIRCDARRVQQIIWNLLSNAVKFSERGGILEVEVRDAGSHVRIVVRDHGVGIDAEFLPYAFERFRQADSSSTRPYGGLGLGLAIARHLTELHGGTVGVASEGIGRGAELTVQLPRAPQVPSDDSFWEDVEDEWDDSSWHTDERPLGHVRVLVVDDEADARDLIAASLVRSGAEVITVGSAGEAIALVERFRPDVLVSDLAMPDTDGFSLIRELRRRETELGRHLPAVALTAYAEKEMGRRALEAGFQVHVAKPFEPQRLVATIGRLCRLN